MVEHTCCEYCIKHEKPECPVKNADPWNRWENFCNEFKDSKNQITTVQEFLDIIIKRLKNYSEIDIMKSVNRNHHQSKYKGEHVKNSTAKAILVDFVNYLATQQGVDLGLTTKYLKK